MIPQDASSGDMDQISARMVSSAGDACSSQPEIPGNMKQENENVTYFASEQRRDGVLRMVIEAKEN
jgi:hypothetical protein